jgi:glucosamine--fructose-6-phosphate aminotransferase (isomerizing)
MCGIYGVINNNHKINIYQQIINGLIQIQHRGYDSSGLCVFNNNQNNYEIHKCISDNNTLAINKLDNIKLTNDNDIFIGIGHNRMATLGNKTLNNAHPHISNDNNFVLVHNGTIDNYLELKQFLIDNGYKFYSETDSEIIVNLISYYFNEFNDMYTSIEKTINLLIGSYAVIIMNIFEPDILYCVKNDCPILIGKNNDSIIVTSEYFAFCNTVIEYIVLDDKDICIIKQNMIVTNNNYDTYKKKIITNNYLPILNSNELLKGYKYNGFWLNKEIYEQNIGINNLINSYVKNNEVIFDNLNEHIDILKNINNIILLANDTSYEYVQHFMKTFMNFKIVLNFNISEFSEVNIPKYGKTLAILISQSGESIKLYKCLKILKTHNISTIGIVNVNNSLLARNVDYVIETLAGREISYIQTKSFTNQIITLFLLTMWFAQIHNINLEKRKKIILDLKKLPNDFDTTLIDIDNKIKNSYHKSIIITNKYNETFNQLLDVLPLQLLTYYLSLNDNINPDVPKI